MYMWLYTVNALAPQRMVASKKGDLRTRGPMLIMGLETGVECISQ
jgi:hypothetical protein